MRPRIAFFLPHLEDGGSQVVPVRLANAMAARGDVDVDCVLVRKAGVHLDSLSSRVRIVDLNARHAFTCVPKVARYLKSARPDSMLCWQGSENIAAALARRISSAPTQIVAGERTFLSARTDVPAWRLRLAIWGRRLVYPLVDKVIAVSRTVGEDLCRLTATPASKVVTIYNPYDFAEIERRSAEPVSHRFFGRGAPVLVSVGRLHSQKNYETLLRAFAEFTSKRDAFLIILGEGEMRPQLEALRSSLGLEERVDMPGFVRNPMAYMGRADLFVLSSRYEGFANVIIEAMLCGCPVVSTDFPGVREALGDSEFGLISPVGDPHALAANIAAMVDSPTPQEKLRARCAPLGVDSIVDRYLSILLPGKAPPGGEAGRPPLLAAAGSRLD